MTMTKEEAIMRLKQNRAAATFYAEVSNRTKTIESELLDVEAFTMAIEALKDRPQGEWIHDYHFGLALPEHKCSVCGEWEYSDTESNYCPNCGADMRGEKE